MARAVPFGGMEIRMCSNNFFSRDSWLFLTVSLDVRTASRTQVRDIFQRTAFRCVIARLFPTPSLSLSKAHTLKGASLSLSVSKSLPPIFHLKTERPTFGKEDEESERLSLHYKHSLSFSLLSLSLDLSLLISLSLSHSRFVHDSVFATTTLRLCKSAYK